MTQKGKSKREESKLHLIMNPSEHLKQDYITYGNILLGYGWCMQKHTGYQAIFLILWMIKLVWNTSKISVHLLQYFI